MIVSPNPIDIKKNELYTYDFKILKTLELAKKLHAAKYKVADEAFIFMDKVSPNKKKVLASTFTDAVVLRYFGKNKIIKKQDAELVLDKGKDYIVSRCNRLFSLKLQDKYKFSEIFKISDSER